MILVPSLFQPSSPYFYLRSWMMAFHVPIQRQLFMLVSSNVLDLRRETGIWRETRGYQGMVTWLLSSLGVSMMKCEIGFFAS